IGLQQAHCRPDTGTVGDDHFLDAYLARQSGGMQGSGTAKGDHAIGTGIATAFYRHNTQGTLHSAVDHGVNTPCSMPDTDTQWLSDLLGDAFYRGIVVKLECTRIEVVRVDIAQHHVGVGYGWLIAAFSVTDGAGYRPGTLRTDLDQPHVDAGNTAPS